MAPSQDALATASAVLGKASLFDQTMAKPDVGMAIAWAEVIGHLNREDCLLAVTDHYRFNTTRIMPKDVLTGVRKIRSDRLDRAADAIPDADPDNIAEWLAALREGRFRAADGTERARPVQQLIEAAAETKSIARRSS